MQITGGMNVMRMSKSSEIRCVLCLTALVVVLVGAGCGGGGTEESNEVQVGVLHSLSGVRGVRCRREHRAVSVGGGVSMGMHRLRFQDGVPHGGFRSHLPVRLQSLQTLLQQADLLLE